MPIYEYQCPECGHVFEEWVNITSATNEAPCPQCGGQAVHIISNTAFVLKGGGWYVTDYGSRKNDGHSDGHDSATVSPAAVGSAASDGSAAKDTPAAAPAKPADAAPASGSNATSASGSNATSASGPAAKPAASSAASA